MKKVLGYFYHNIMSTRLCLHSYSYLYFGFQMNSWASQQSTNHIDPLTKSSMATCLFFLVLCLPITDLLTSRDAFHTSQYDTVLYHCQPTPKLYQPLYTSVLGEGGGEWSNSYFGSPWKRRIAQSKTSKQFAHQSSNSSS